MPFYIKQGDITTLSVDAVVNAANASLLGGGGVDGAIHRAAGPALREYCAGLGGCRVGEAKLSPGFALPARWIIHTVGPVWQGGNRNEEALLRACYRNSLALALETGCESVAFPLISAGVYGYPKEQALHVAIQEIGAFLQTQEMEVILTIYDPAGFRLSGRRFPVLRAMLGRGLPNDAFGPAEGSDWGAAALSGQYKAAACPPAASGAARPPAEAAPQPKKQQRASLFPRRRKEKQAESAVPAPAVKPVPPAPAAPAYADEEAVLAAAERPAALDERLRCLDESFSQMLLRKIDEKGMTDAACYKRANVDRKLFSKIRSDPGYRPSKPTAIAFAIALELPLAETRELLMKAGFALSPSSAFDVIIEYFISAGNYDIFEINEALFTFDQNLLGA